MPEAKSGLARASMRPVEDAQEIVLEVVRGLVIELHPDMVESRLVQLDSDLDRDLALDSLTRAELLLRLNRKFKVQLSERLLGEVSRPRDLLNAVLAAGAAVAPAAPRPAPHLTLESVDEPLEAKTLVEALAQHAKRHGARENVLLWRAEGASGASDVS